MKRLRRAGSRSQSWWSMMVKQAADLRGQAFSLANLLAYQAEAVVSRTLIRKGAGTVTVFAFDAGQGLSEHTAPFDALVQILEGSAQVTIAGTRLRLQAGDCAILPAQKPHAVQALSRFKMLLTMIKSPTGPRVATGHSV